MFTNMINNITDFLEAVGEALCRPAKVQPRTVIDDGNKMEVVESNPYDFVVRTTMADGRSWNTRVGRLSKLISDNSPKSTPA